MAEDINLIFEKYLEVVEESKAQKTQLSPGARATAGQHYWKGALAGNLGTKEGHNFFAGNFPQIPDYQSQKIKDEIREILINKELQDPSMHFSVTGENSTLDKNTQNTFEKMRKSKHMDRFLVINGDSGDILIPFFDLPRAINEFSLYARSYTTDPKEKKAIANFLEKSLGMILDEENYKRIYKNTSVFFDNRVFKQDHTENQIHTGDTYENHKEGIISALNGLNETPVKFIDPKLEPSFYTLRTHTMRGGKEVHRHSLFGTTNVRTKFSPKKEQPQENLPQTSGITTLHKTGRSATEEEVLQDQIKTLKKQMIALVFKKAPKSEIDDVKSKIDELNRASLKAAPSVGAAVENLEPTKPKKTIKKTSKGKIKKESYQPFVREILF